MGILASCKPRRDVLEGDLEDAIFAADFGDLIAGDPRTPPVYADAETFFANTHPAADLKTVLEAVFNKLAKPQGGGTALRLSTGFGGGKTHTLMCLWHLARNITDTSMGLELLPSTGRPDRVTVVAVDASKAGSPEFLRHGAITTHSLQGEIAYQLGGASALKNLGKSDSIEAQPNEQLLESLLPAGPVLFLLDELVIYMAGLSGTGQKNLLGVVQKLVSIVVKRPQTVLVITDPGAQLAYQRASKDLSQMMAANELSEVLGRKVTDYDPIGSEAAKVIARRLFDTIDSSAAQAAADLYHATYLRVAEEQPSLLPDSVVTEEYARRLEESYPFHPRLLDTARDRLGALEEFQKSRGVLRLFARILRDLWERGEELELITAGDLNWSNPRLRGDLLDRLSRKNFAAAVSADVEGHALELDGGQRGVHCRAASALLLESLPMSGSSGLTSDDLSLATLRPDEGGPEPAEALDRLVGVCWHTYPMAGGRGWQFRYDPNIIKQIEQRRAQVSREDAEARVLSEARDYYSGSAFKLSAWPENARQVADEANLQLALCQSEEIARLVCETRDDSVPSAKQPRYHINAIVAVTATQSAYATAIVNAQKVIALEEIEAENKQGEAGAQMREQLSRIKPEIVKQHRLQTRRAFDRVILANGKSSSIDEQYQAGEDEILKSPRGQQVLLKYLTAKELIYESTDALDPAKFVKEVLPGAIPLAGQVGVYTTAAVKSRMYGTQGLRLIREDETIRRTLMGAMKAGKILLRTEDGCVFDAKGAVEGPPGARRRTERVLPGIALGDQVWVTMFDADVAKTWLHVDATKPKSGGDKEGQGTGGGEGNPPPPPPPPSDQWFYGAEACARAAEQRPLKKLDLRAGTPASAKSLAMLAQPFGADTLFLSVNTTGTARLGGILSFSADRVKPTHPAKPLDMACLVFSSLEDGSHFEATQHLEFGAGRWGMGLQLQSLEPSESNELTVAGFFGPIQEGMA
jgi:hypothetical protein